MINIKVSKAVHCNGDYSLFLSFPYDPKVIDIIRGLPNKFWNAQDKIWEVPVNKLGLLLQSLPDYDFDISGEYVSLEKPKAIIPKGFKFKTKPFEHQIAGFNYGLQYDRWLLGDEMGLGKTKQVIDIAVAKKLAKGYKHCLIICGVNGLKWNWVNEVATHSDEQAFILGQKTNTKGKVVIGSSLDKLNSLSDMDQLPYFIVTNIETLRYKEWTGEWETKRGKKSKVYTYPITDKLAELCNAGEIDMIAFDESHKCKNTKSDQGEQLLRLQAETMIAMTGTPLMNQPMDLFIIFKWLGYEKHTYWSFEKHYAIKGGFGGYQIVGYKNLEELQERLNEIMLRRKKEDVLDLPDKVYIDEYVEMTPAQKKIYDEVTSDIKDNIDQIAIAPNPLAELIRMRQATGFTGILSSSILESAKMDRMLELVEEAVSNNKKIIIFSNWTQMTDAIYDRLEEHGYKVAQITGQTPDNQRQHLVDTFQNTNDIQIMLGTSGAMGTGITLSEATIEIFMDEPWNMALKQQCEDRAHRIGQKNNLTIYTLLCKDTIDERIHELVEKKGMMADALVDGKVVGNKRELLNFLLS